MADLVEFKTLKAILELEKDGISDYPRLEVIAAAVPSSFEMYAGRKFEEVDKRVESGNTEIGRPTKFLHLHALPIKSITSVVIDGRTIGTSEYVVDAYGVRLLASVSGVSWTVEYQGGFDEFPADLKYTAAIQAAYESQNMDVLGAQTVSSEGGTVTTPGFKLLPEVQRRLSNYVHVESFA